MLITSPFAYMIPCQTSKQNDSWFLESKETVFCGTFEIKDQINAENTGIIN